MEQFPSAAAQGQAQRPAILNPMDVVQQRQALQLQRQALAKGQQDVLQSKQQTQNEAATHAAQVQTAADDAAARQALQATNGDEEKAAGVLRAGGFSTVADKIDASRATRAKADAATMTEALKNANTKLEMTSQILQGVDSEEKFQLAVPALLPILGKEGVAKLGDHYNPETVKFALATGTKQTDFMKAKQDAIAHSDKLLEQGVPQRDEQGNLKLTPKAEKEWTEGAAKMFSTAQSPEDFAQDIAVLKHLQYPQEIIDKFGQFDAALPDRVQAMLVTPKDASSVEGGFQDFYKQYLKDNKLPRRADNELKARQLFEASNRSPQTVPLDKQIAEDWIAKHPGKTLADFNEANKTIAGTNNFNLANPSYADNEVKYFANQIAKDPDSIMPMLQGNKTLKEQVNKELAKQGVDVDKLSSSTRQLGQTAKALLPEFETVLKQVDTPDMRAKLGPVLGRWNEFLAGKVGTGPEFADLRAKVDLLKTGVLRAHFGARGGQGILQRFDGLADAGKMDADTLISALSGMRDFLKDVYVDPRYSAGAPGAANSTAKPFVVPGGALDQLLKKK